MTDRIIAMQQALVVGIVKKKVDENPFCDALRCKVCGKIVERGIMNVMNHMEKCPVGLVDFETNVYDADYEIIEPKQLTEGDKQ